ncbi:TPA: DNA (cytosine-5-)-methyltransferase [Streptococcus suis]|nr:DNA (cytosine-5-)-methyltransferase [Streptococcus suis]HEM4739351.1 DNA (cytosine-5-)-methyltransferase [Streptococcus suis]HEM4847860.1 DNA (cytosine-5-)-methyltransferase [Streptococcus suis]
MKELKVASLFSGGGGTDIGFVGGFDFLGKYYSKNQIKIVYANDIEDSANKMFEKNFGIVPDNRSIREVDSKDIPPFDILTGGFPCQSFSVSAQNPKRLGIKDEKGTLFFEMVRILKDHQPKAFFAENVKGILSANKKEAFPLIIQEFEKAGYNVSYKLCVATKYGVPQKRERVFIVGIRKDLDFRFEFPEEPLRNIEDYIPIKTILQHEIEERYYFSEKAVQGMLNSKSGKKMNKGRAQDIEKPSNTVSSHLAKVSLNSTDPVLLENGRYRRYTPREVARIQSFPEDYELIGSESAQYRMLGNAIPPVMMWYVAKKMVEDLQNHVQVSKKQQLRNRLGQIDLFEAS